MASSSSLNLLFLITLSLSFSLYNRSSSSSAFAKQLHAHTRKEDSFLLYSHKDSLRLQSLFSRIATATTRKTKRKTKMNMDDDRTAAQEGYLTKNKLIATLESGVSLGSGEYLMDVYIGTPPRHFSLIVDTGSDLNWIQCAPCRDCFPQHGPLYHPNLSSTYRNLTCNDPRCALVDSSPAAPCHSSTCQYFYWYGDQSNTTGDLASEAFTVNLTTATDPEETMVIEGVVFGCGHWNRGLFHGAAGLLGLGRGPLSFASQMRSLYGHTFSYCLVDRNSDLLVTSKLIFGGGEGEGDDNQYPNMNYTSFAAADNPMADTFYYVHVKGVRVGGELLSVPPETWDLAVDGTGGTIIDSGTTLSYFVRPAYRVIRGAFVRKVTYPLVEDIFPVLNPCYNVSGVEEVEMPGFAIEFVDGAVWEFPLDNYFIRLEPEDIVCLAFLETPRSSPLSIIGNYQQQNFRILYDTNRSRLGFAPAKCSQV